MKKKDSEKKIEKQLGEWAKSRGGYSIKMLSDFINGVPDRLILLPGAVLFFAELKSTNKTASKIQLLIHRKIKKLGFKVYVIDTFEKLNEIIQRYEPPQT